MYLDDHVRAKKSLAYWGELLQEWVFMVHRVYRISKKRSSVHGESERANTGLLAAAAVKNGWVALEECRTEKIAKKGSETYYGRCDLVLWRDQRHHEIEAKCCRVNLFGSWERTIRSHQRSMDDSSRSTYAGYRSEKKIAVTYIIPIITLKKLEIYTDDEISSELLKMIKFLKKETSPRLLSYAFPGPADMEGREKKALGVILIGDLM